MISVKLRDKDEIIVQIHGKHFPTLLQQVKSLRTGQYEEGVGWIFPATEIDRLIRAVENINVAYLSPYEEIKYGRKPEPFIEETKITPISEKYKDIPITIPDYQKLGAGFLIQEGKCILGDRVGVGKTIQSGYAIKYGLKNKLFSKVLIVCLNTIKYQWQNELSEKFNLTKSLVINGTIKQREKQWQEIKGKNILIVNYETLLSEKDMANVQKFGADVIVVDEAHYTKNLDAKRTKAVHKIKTNYAWLLTGTPMENKPEEIFALMKYIAPDVLGNKKQFEKDYMCYDFNTKLKVPIFIGYRDLTTLHAKIKPYMLRRRIEDIPEADLASLPELMPPTNVYVDMNKDQIKAYEYIISNKAAIVELIRKQIATQQQEDALKGYDMLMVGLSHSCDILISSESGLAKKIVKETGIKNKEAKKIDTAIEMIEDLIDGGSKIVVFTELKASQKLMSEKLTKKGIKHLLLSSATSSADREKNKVAFTKDDSIKVFIATDAGKEGINLQASNYLINLDMPWKPSTYEQRMGRIRRLGSKHSKCFVINMISVDPAEVITTIDQRRMNTIIRKQGLIDTVVEGK